MRLRAGLGLLALGLAAGSSRAEPVFVIEQLVVSVSSSPGADGERIAQAKSGERLELIERQGDEAHVRLANGKEGWVKASYISTEEPLQVRLNERTAELDKLRQEAAGLREEQTRLQSELTSARAAPSQTSSTPVRETVFLREPGRQGQTPWGLLMGLSFSMLLVGFALGWIALDRRIRRRYGGLRIY